MNDAVHVLARGVCVKEGKILLCENKKRGFFYLPGGHVEHQESAAQALIRELDEEVGVRFSVQKFLGVFEYVFIPDNSGKCHNHEYNFIFQVDAPEVLVTENPGSLEDGIAFAWVALSDLDQTSFKPTRLKEPLMDWLKAGAQAGLVTVIE